MLKLTFILERACDRYHPENFILIANYLILVVSWEMLLRNSELKLDMNK